MRISITNKFLSFVALLSFNLAFFFSSLAEEAVSIQPLDVEQSIQEIDPELDELLKNPEIIELLKKEQADMLEPMLGQLLDQLKKIDGIFELWAQIVNNNQLRNVNKNEIISQIKMWRKNIIGQLMKSSYVVVDPMSIKILSEINKTIVAYLELVAKNGLKSFPDISFDEIITRSIKEEVDLELVKKTIQLNNKHLVKLDRDSKYIGLSFFNRMYRRSEQFAHEYSLFRKALIGMGLYLAGYILISRLEPDWVQDVPVLGWLKNSMFGDKPRYGHKSNSILNEKIMQDALNEVGDLSHATARELVDNLHLMHKIHNIGNIETQPELINNEKLRWLGKIEHYLGTHGLGILNLTVPEMLTIPVLASFYREDWKDVTTWLKKNAEIVRSKLRGGPIEHQVESWHKEPQLRFKDIIGKEHIKNELMRIVHFIRDQDRYIRAGNRPETGYLLLGGTGTGKSAMAEALAGEMKDVLAEFGLADKLNFYNFSAAEIKQYGGIETIVLFAKQNAPAVIFIDEIDMTMWQRDRDADNTSLALTTLSGAMTKDVEHTVIIIGATNRAKNLDSALLRKGRFGKILFFDNPTYQDRLAFLKQELENRSIITIADEYLQQLAAESDKCIMPQLSSVIEKALYYAKINNETLTDEHLEKAFDEEVRQIIFDKIEMPDNEFQLIALHEAGHTLAALLLSSSYQLIKATLLPVMAHIQEEAVWMKYWEDKQRQKPIEHGKTFVMQASKNSVNIESYNDLINEIKLELAGHAAEIVIYGNTSYKHHAADRERALVIAKQLALKGLRAEQLDEKQREKINQQAMEILERCEQEMIELFSKHKDQLLTIADALKEKHTMAAVEIKTLIDQEAASL